MVNIFELVLSLSISGTLVGLLLFAIKAFTKNKFMKSWHYYIWLIVIFRLLLPIRLETNLVGSFFHSQPAVVHMDVSEPDMQDEAGSSSISDSGEAAKSFVPSDTESESLSPNPSAFPNRQPILSYIWIIWVFGIILSLTIKIVDYKNFLSYLCSSNKKVTDQKQLSVLDDVTMDLHIKSNIPLYENSLVISPMLAGLFHPFIVLPQKGIKEEQLYYILAHELTHYKRKDLWYKWLFQLTWSIHWFNPLLYFINREINTLCELSCDEKVMGFLKNEERSAYGNMLLDAAQLTITYKNNVLSTTLIENKHNLKERLKGIMNYKKHSNLVLAISFLSIAVIILTAAIFGAKSSDASAKSSETEANNKASRRYEDRYYSSLGSFLGDTIGRYVTDLAENISTGIADSVWDWDWDWGWDNWNNYNPPVANKNGKAYKAYDDDALLAQKDISDYLHCYTWSGGNHKLTINGMYFTGTYSILIANAKKDTAITMDSSYTCEKGKFKIVLVDPDKKVTTLSQSKPSTQITLKKGVNYIKMAGQDSKVTNLNIAFKNITASDFEYIADSEEEAIAVNIKEKLKNGTWTYSEIKKAAPYMEEEDLSYCIGEIIKQGISISASQLSYLVSMSDEELTMKYIREALKKDRALTLKQITAILPFLYEEDVAYLFDYAVKNFSSIPQNSISIFCAYVDTDIITSYILRWNKEQLTFEIIEQLIPYLDEDELEDILNRYLKVGNKLTFDQMNQIISYLNEDSISSIVSQLVREKMITESQGKELLEVWGDYDWDDYDWNDYDWDNYS